MSSQYKFIDTTTGTLTEKLIAAYESICGVKVYPASPERLFIAWVEAAILDERVLTNWTGNQNIPSRADGANLDALSELFYTQKRPEAKSAECTVRFRITAAQTSAILIPAGTRVTEGSLRSGVRGEEKLIWETEEDISVPAGTLYADGLVRCQTPGVAANGIMPGKIDTAVDLWDYIDGCENITVTDGGTDAATDAEFYELMRQSMEAFSVAGPSGAYKYHAMQVSPELSDVIAVNPKKDDLGNPIDGAGIVEIYALGPDGFEASETMKAAILEACSADGVRPLTDHVFVKDPILVPYTIDLTYYLPRTSPLGGAAIVAAVNKAVEEYKAWQSAKLGRDINPSQLIGMLMDCGIKRVVVRSPAFTELSDGSFEDPSDYRKPQYANCAAVNIVNGGVEDE